MAANCLASRLAPPTSAPSISSSFIKLFDVIGFAAAAVQNAQRLARFRTEQACGKSTKKTVRFSRDFRGCRATRADGPNRFVRHDDT